MKKQPISFNWPATLSFSAASENENERFSRGKLKVFYKGETADHRFFSDEFGNELVKSLPYTPIVSHYDEEKDDFVGHATEQEIYGIVDPKGSITFEKDDAGTTWCVCDTVYYTERPDKVGEIAKKIEGHCQSLELDPSTAKYKINYDSKQHFKNVEFTAGKFIGVSVLGKDQKPAFTGSSFFSVDEAFENKMKLLRDYCEAKHDQPDGDIEMNLQEFMTLSWGDISVKVEEAIAAEYQEEYFTHVVDMFDDCAIAHFYSYIDGKCRLMRVRYAVDENGKITLGDVNEVHITYEDVVEPAIDETGVTQATANSSESEPAADPTPVASESTEQSFAEDSEVVTDEPVADPAPVAEPVVEQATEPAPVVENVVPEEPATVVEATPAFDAEPEPVTNAEVTNIQQKASVDDEQTKTENSSSTSFAESERAEFEALKKEKKINLLNSYKGYLSDEEYADFESRVDDFSDDSLEIALLKKYKTFTEQQASKQPKIRVLALDTPSTKASTRNELDDFIAKQLGR